LSTVLLIAHLDKLTPFLKNKMLLSRGIFMRTERIFYMPEDLPIPYKFKKVAERWILYELPNEQHDFKKIVSMAECSSGLGPLKGWLKVETKHLIPKPKSVREAHLNEVGLSCKKVDLVAEDEFGTNLQEREQGGKA